MERIRQCIESDEAPLMGPNIWILRTALLIPPKSKLGKLLAIVVHEMVAFFVLTQFIDLYMTRTNLDLVLTNLKTTMLSFICVIKSNSFLLWQGRWKNIIDYVTESDKYERKTTNARRKLIIDSYTKYCRRMTYSYWIFVYITAFTTVVPPLIQYFISAAFREDIHNGIEPFPHVLNSWMPIDKLTSPGCWITVAWHLTVSMCGGAIVISYDTCIMVVMVYFGGKLDLLRERCKEMLGQGAANVEDSIFDVKLRELHHGHILLVKYSRLFNSVLSPVMFVYVVMCSLMLCASAYQITEASDAGQQLLLANYLVFGIAQLLIFCWHSNDVLIKNDTLPYGPYESEWWVASLKQRKAVMMLTEQLRIKQVFSAGPFTYLTLPTFVTILKGAYSYYTLIKK